MDQQHSKFVLATGFGTYTNPTSLLPLTSKFFRSFLERTFSKGAHVSSTNFLPFSRSDLSNQGNIPWRGTRKTSFG